MRSVTSKLLIVVLSLGLVFGTSGCRRLLKRRPTGTGSSTTGTTGATGTTAQTPQDDADDQLTEKLDEYIKCLNTISSRAFQARKQYFAFIPKTGPKGTETFASTFTLTSGAATNCSAGVAKAKAMPPSDAKLEGVGSDFSNAASTLDPLLTQLNQYFDNKDFRDDKWAKGKALHPQVTLAFERFAKADHELHTTLDGITKPLAQRTLARLERDEGKKFRYHRKHVLNTARELVETADPPGEDDDVDFTVYGNAFADFEKALDDLRAYGSTHKPDLANRALAPNWPVADSHFESFVRGADDYKKHAKDFWRCLRDAPAAAKTPSGKIDVDKMKTCPDGKPGELQDTTIRKYNEFIRTSNSNAFP
jgi:hypothetical protein